MNQYIYKIMPRELWEEAVSCGSFVGSEFDRADGFIHFSSADQVAATAEKYFARQGNLLLIAVRSQSLGSALKWEPSRDGQLFPHLYGSLSVADVVSVEALPLAADGSHVFPDGVI